MENYSTITAVPAPETALAANDPADEQVIGMVNASADKILHDRTVAQYRAQRRTEWDRLCGRINQSIERGRCWAAISLILDIIMACTLVWAFRMLMLSELLPVWLCTMVQLTGGFAAIACTVGLTCLWMGSDGHRQ